jgi:DNA-binding IclR family transcriptional regulator
MTNRVQAVERSISILMALANGARTLTDVTRATGLSKGTAFRLLASLNHEQLVVKDPAANVYLLGPGFLRMFQGVMGDLGSIGTLARPHLQELWRTSGETVALHVSLGAERICVAELPSPQPIRYVSKVGATAPLHVGSAGKVLLAFLEPIRLERTLAALSLAPMTGATTTDPAVLRQELAEVQRQGWAMSSGERITGASAITVPVSGGPGVLAALSVLGPSDRLTTQARMALLPALRTAAEGIEATLANGNLAIEDDAATGRVAN